MRKLNMPISTYKKGQLLPEKEQMIVKNKSKKEKKH